MLKSRTARISLAIAITLGVLAGAGYARLRVLSYNTFQYYDAAALARNLQAKFDPRVILVLEPMFCSEERSCIEFKVLSYESDPVVQEQVAEYVLNMCDGSTSNQMPCQKDGDGRLNKVNLYMHDYPSRLCARKLEINRNTPKSVVKKSCDVRK